MTPTPPRPPEADAKFIVLMERIREGDDNAVRQLLEDYNPPLVHAIVKMMPLKLKQKCDPDEIAIEIWRDFLSERCLNLNLNRPEELISLLTRVAHYQVAKIAYLFRTRKHDDLAISLSWDFEPSDFTVVWDPEVVSPKDYADLVAAMGDLVRAEGGAGVERIREQGFGVPTGKGAKV